MGVTINKLGTYAADNITELKLTGFGGNLGMKDDLHQQITQLSRQTPGVTLVQSLQHLVALFKQAMSQQSVVLLPVPEATVRATQAGNDTHQGRKLAQIRLLGQNKSPRYSKIIQGGCYGYQKLIEYLWKKSQQGSLVPMSCRCPRRKAAAGTACLPAA
jgi:hypothetical protein